MKSITQNQINENLKNVQEGKPLNIPLSILNGEFKKQYFKCKNCGKSISEGNISGFCGRCLVKFSPEVKKRMREYQQRPEVKKRKREYQREYQQRPEVKKRMREYQREWTRKKFKIPKSKWKIN